MMPKIRKVIGMILCLLTCFVLAACASENAVSESEAVAEQISTEVVEEETVASESEMETVVEETVSEVPTGPQSVAEWARSMDTSVPKLTVWNDITKEGRLIADEEIIILKDGDMIVICTKEKESGLSFDTDLLLEDIESRISDKYVRFKFNKFIAEETLFELRVTVAGVEYPFSFLLISEGAPISTAEKVLSGKEWAISLEYDEPKLVAWNDKTETREVIDNGGTYVMQEGDILGVYHPEEYYIFNVSSEFDFASALTNIAKVTIIEYQLPSESQDIHLEVEVMDENDEFITFNFVVTTP